jgi:pyruvate decarboxylase
MGKGSMDETLHNYCGIYAGSATRSTLKERIEKADLVITIGSIKSDFNTAGFTYNISTLSEIDLHSDTIRVKYSQYPGVRMNGVLTSLAARFKSGVKLNITPGPKIANVIPQSLGSDSITHAWLWPTLGGWLQSGDIVVTETGTANFGIMETHFPPKVMAINQYLWGSIGYATPATQGVAIAANEVGLGRTILWTGGTLSLLSCLI